MSKIIPGIINSSGLFVENKNEADIIDRNAVALMDIYNSYTKENPQKMKNDFKKILSSDFVYDEAGTGMVYNSPEDFSNALIQWKSCFSDAKGTIHRTTRKGNLVFHENTFRGTHDGVFNMPGYETKATGRTVVVRSAMVVEFNKDGKIKKLTHYFDNFTQMKQVGAVPLVPKE